MINSLVFSITTNQAQPTLNSINLIVIQFNTKQHIPNSTSIIQLTHSKISSFPYLTNNQQALGILRQLHKHIKPYLFLRTTKILLGYTFKITNQQIVL